MTARRSAPVPRRAAGFTLIEMVMVIAVTGVLAAAVGRFIAQPVEGALDAARRARLTDAAETVLARMTRELRLALPNSVRVDASGKVVEFLRVHAGARYRAEAPGDPLDFAASSDTFDVLGTLVDAGTVDAAAGAGVAECATGAVDCLAIYNTGQTGADAWSLDNMAGVRAAAAGSVGFGAAAPFPFRSPGQRFYVVDTPVAFLCDDAGAGVVRRYDGHAVNADQSAVDSHGELIAAGAAEAVVTDRVTGCGFDYQPGTATRGGLVTLTITLSEQGESVTLLQQAHVSNLP